MPQSPTTRLALYRPLADGSELVNVQQDLNNNWDKLDTKVGFLAVTASTRPSAPYSGQHIRETDTGRLWVSNGSAPASGSWSEIMTPGTAQTVTQQLTLSGSGFALVKRSATSDTAYQAMLAADTQPRLLVTADGKHSWGPGGSTAVDTNLYRSGVNQLKTDDDLVVAGALTVSAGIAVSGVGQVQFVRKTADETVASSTTLQNDNDLLLPVAANAVYLAELVLMTVNASVFTADISTAFTYPTGSTVQVAGIGPHNSDLTAGSMSAAEWISRQNQTGTASTAVPYGVGTIITGVTLKVQIATGSTAGNLTLQWAQNTSNAAGTTVKAGSWMRMERVA